MFTFLADVRNVGLLIEFIFRLPVDWQIWRHFGFVFIPSDSTSAKDHLNTNCLRESEMI